MWVLGIFFVSVLCFAPNVLALSGLPILVCRLPVLVFSGLPILVCCFAGSGYFWIPHSCLPFLVLSGLPILVCCLPVLVISGFPILVCRFWFFQDCPFLLAVFRFWIFLDCPFLFAVCRFGLFYRLFTLLLHINDLLKWEGLFNVKHGIFHELVFRVLVWSNLR